MHYANGRAAQNGDPVVGQIGDTTPPRIVAGVIDKLNAGATACNGVIVTPFIGGTESLWVTVGECYHAQDALDAVRLAIHPAAKEAPAKPV